MCGKNVVDRFSGDSIEHVDNIKEEHGMGWHQKVGLEGVGDSSMAWLR